MNLKELLKLNTKEQSEMVLAWVIAQKNVEQVFKLVKLGHPVSPFILNVMIEYGFEKNIPKLLTNAKWFFPAVKDWMKEYYQDQYKAKIVELGLKEFINLEFTVDDCVKYELWEELVRRNHCKYVEEAKGLEFLEKFESQNVRLYLGATGRFDKLFQSRCFDIILQYHGGLNYLSENASDDDLRSIIKKRAQMPDEWIYVVDLLIKRGQGNEFFETKNVKIAERIISQGFTDKLVEANNWEMLFQNNKYDSIDWEDAYHTPDNSQIIPRLVFAKQWAFLAEHKQRLILFKNKQFV